MISADGSATEAVNQNIYTAKWGLWKSILFLNTHFWLWNKIQLTDHFVEKILNGAYLY